MGIDTSKDYFCDIGLDKGLKFKFRPFGKTANYYSFENWSVTVPTADKLYEYFLLEILDEKKAKTSAEFKEKKIKLIDQENKKQEIFLFQFEEIIVKEKFKTSEYFSINESKKWLINTKEVATSTAPDELINTKTWDKNYKCNLIPSNKEVDCELYKLNYVTLKNSSIFGHTKYKQEEVKEKSEITPNTTFKLKVNSKQLPTLKLDGTETIQVIHKGTKAIYATWIPKFELQENEIFGDTNLVIGKFAETITDATATTFTCKLPNKELEAKDCDIYKFNSQGTDLSSLTFKTTKITTANNIEASKYFVLDLKDQVIKSKITNIDKQTVEITVKTNPTKTTQFNFEKSLIAIINLANNNKIIYSYERKISIIFFK